MRECEKGGWVGGGDIREWEKGERHGMRVKTGWHLRECVGGGGEVSMGTGGISKMGTSSPTPHHLFHVVGRLHRRRSHPPSKLYRLSTCYDSALSYMVSLITGRIIKNFMACCFRLVNIRLK